jgi:ketosteroid isomerase-like protein
MPVRRDLPTPDHPNAARILAAKHGVTPGRDLDPMFAVQAPDMVAHIPGTEPHRRRVALARRARRGGAEPRRARRRHDPHRPARGGHRRVRDQRAARDGAPARRARLDTVLTEVWRLQDGVCVELWDHFEDLGAWDAFWR